MATGPATAAAENISLPDVSNFESVTGFGVKAEAGGKRVEIGADRYMSELGHDDLMLERQAHGMLGQRLDPRASRVLPEARADDRLLHDRVANERVVRASQSSTIWLVERMLRHSSFTKIFMDVFAGTWSHGKVEWHKRNIFLLLEFPIHQRDRNTCLLVLSQQCE